MTTKIELVIENGEGGFLDTDVSITRTVDSPTGKKGTPHNNRGYYGTMSKGGRDKDGKFQKQKEK
tara:strand:+ start:2923 stop:3117 length:195 start_codon:yes stop_codon:yes gene_type:complete